MTVIPGRAALVRPRSADSPGGHVRHADPGPADALRAAPPSRSILGMRVDATSYGDAVSRVLAWARRGDSRYVCVATAHMVMEAYDSPVYRAAVNDADLVTPDGMPLVWGLRLLGIRSASRVYGPDLTPVLLAAASRAGLPVGFYGGRAETLSTLVAALTARFPGLRVACAISPPFRPQSQEEDDADILRINASGARIVFVGLGCPKQERWMAAHAPRMRAVLVGVGAAFDFLAGSKRQAPGWIQRAGLEWLFRLCSEPRRLWRRYLQHGPRFVALFALQLLGARPAGDAGEPIEPI
jgi:N-acetylglucosaminyldiphosphoundecaprenol N-acetyl-beta-D-mannosaminyltransferase